LRQLQPKDTQKLKILPEKNAVISGNLLMLSGNPQNFEFYNYNENMAA